MYDGFNEVTTNFYDEQGQLIETRSSTLLANGTPSEIISHTAYDANGRVVFTTDAFLDGDLTTPGTETVYDALGRVEQTIRYDDLDIALVAHTTSNPNADNLKKLATGILADDVTKGNVLSSNQTFYDEQGRVEFTVDAAGLISEFKYNVAGQQIESIQYLTGTFDEATSTVIDIVNPATDVLSTTFEYDKLGRQELVTDALGHSTRSVYDDLGRVIKTIFHDGTQTETVYNDLGHRVAEIAQHDPLTQGPDKSAITTNYEYDTSGRLIAVILPPVVDPATSNTVRPRYEYVYDIYGNQTLIRDNVIHDASGLENHDRTNARETEFTYDHLNRQVARTLPLGQALTGEVRNFRERTFYDPSGRQARTIDFEGRTTDFVYDDLGRLDETHYFAPGVNPDVAPPNEITDYIYDDLGRQMQVIQDFDGDLLTTTDQRVTENFFEELGQLDRVTTPEGTIHYDYFLDTGQLQRTYTGADLVNARTQTDYTYDRLGRLETVTAVKQNSAPVNDITTYQYDAVGNLAFVIVAADVPGSSTVSQYTYDELNRLDLLEHYFDANNNQQFDAGDRRLATFDYEVRADGRRTGVTEETYDIAGLLTQTNTIAWVYDGLNRLVAEYFDGEGTTHDFIDFYTYDLIGNRKKKEHDADPLFTGITQPTDLLSSTPNFTNGTGDETTTYVYDDNDRLLTEATVDNTAAAKKTTTYEYGGVGNPGTEQTKKVETNHTTGVTKTTDSTYNLQGRLSRVEIDDTSDGTPDTTIDYEYSDSGIRVSQTKDDGTGPIKTRYLVDGNNHTGYAQVLEAWEDLNSNGVRDAGELTSYVLGHDVISQWLSNPPAGVLPAQFLLYDGHGSTRGLVDAMGLPVAPGGKQQVFAYDAYGNQLVGSGLTTAAAALTTLLYSGEFSDLATGLQYLRARFYDPSSGRFNRVDPFAGNINDPQSLHKYLYTHGDPVNGIDPSGEFIFTLLSLLFASAITAKFGLLGLGAVVTVSGLADALLIDAALTAYAASSRANGVNIPLHDRTKLFGEFLDVGTVASHSAARQRVGSPQVNKFPKNATTIAAGVGENRIVNRGAIGGSFVGTSACGPCVGVVIVTPADMIAFHFTAQDDPIATFNAIGPFPAGSRAVLTQSSNPSESGDALARLTLGRTLDYLEDDPNITLDGFVGDGSVWVDSSGKYYAP